MNEVKSESMETVAVRRAPELAREGRAASARFEQGLVDCRPRLFRTALLMLGAREEAEDATQRSLLKALEGKARFRADSELYTWLYRILVNTCKDLYKAKSRVTRATVPAEVVLREALASEPTGEEALAQREEAARVRRALHGLDPRLREALVLRHYEEMSYEQMAAVLEVPIGTVRSRLSAARERLRQALIGAEAKPGVTTP